MRIPDYLNGPRPTPETRQSSVDQGSRVDRAGNGDKSQSGVKGAELAQHIAAPELIELTNQLRELPEVREELVADVAKRLQSGSYHTREAAERTAERLLGETT